MRRFEKFVSSIVLAAFLVTTTLTDLSVAVTMSDKLSPPAVSGTLMDIEHKDMGRIRIALENQLMALDRARSIGIHTDFQALKTIFGEQMRVEWTSRERSVYQPVDMQFFFHELTPTLRGPCVMCRVTDPQNPRTPPRTYYAIFSLARDATSGFPVSVYSKKEYDDNNGFALAVPDRADHDAEAIARYIQHEQIIDRWIADHMERGESMSLDGNAAHAAFIQEIFWHPGACEAERELNELSVENKYWLVNTAEKTPVIIIKVKNGEKRPVIIEGGVEVTVDSHASQNAIYIFLDEFSYDIVRSGLHGGKYDVRGGAGNIETTIHSRVTPLLIHEIGVKFGFAWRVTDHKMIENDLDRAYQLALQAQRDPSLRETDAYRSAMKLVRERIDSLEGQPVDLDRNSVGRDYAAGKKPAAGSAPGTAPAGDRMTGKAGRSGMKDPAAQGRSWSAEQPRDNTGRFGRLAGKSPEDVWLVIMMAGLNERFSFTMDDFMKAYEGARTRASVLQYGFSEPAPVNPEGIFRQDLAALADRGYLTATKAGTTTYRVADVYRADKSYATNFRAFSAIAEYAVRALGYSRVDYKDGRRLMTEIVRMKGAVTVREQIGFDLETGTISFLNVEAGTTYGNRFEIAPGKATILSTAASVAPFEYQARYGSPIINVIASSSGELIMIMKREFYDAYMERGNKLRIPVVTITREGDHTVGGDGLMIPRPDAVAFEPKQTRAARTEPGKNPEDALTVIALMPSLDHEPFTVLEYLAAYDEVRAAYPSLGFTALAKKDPFSTARRDLQKLVGRGYLVRVPVNGRKYAYRLTQTGVDAVAATRTGREPLLSEKLDSAIPQKLLDAVRTSGKKLSVGVPKEIKPFAERVGLTPEGVRVLVANGIRVIVEKGAGRGHFSDAAYIAAGAEMKGTAKEVWAEADIIKKVKEPLETDDPDTNEFDLMREGQIIFTYFHLASPDCAKLTEVLLKKRALAVAFETIEVTKNGITRTPVLEPMSIIAGNLGAYFGVIFDAESRIVKQGGRKVVRLTAAGNAMMARVKKDYLEATGFKDAAEGKKAVVLGGGISGLRMALGLLGSGASVTITDVKPERVAELKALLAKYGSRATVIQVSKDINDLPPALLARLKAADIVGGCVLIPGAPAPQLSRAVMQAISSKDEGGKPKTFVDIAIDQGGNFYGAHSTYYSEPAFVDEFHNKRFSVANMPDFVGGVASVALEKSNIAYNLALALGFEKAVGLFPELRGGVNAMNGALKYKKLAAAYPSLPMEEWPRLSPAASLSAIDNALELTAPELASVRNGFLDQMVAGLAGEPSSLDMMPSFAAPPTGTEKGDYFAVDIGGSNLRVLGKRLDGRGGHADIGAQKVAPFTVAHKTGSEKQLFDHIARTIKAYLDENRIGSSREVRMSVTWSFPIEQTAIDAGRHKEWTKGWSVPGVVGKDIVGLVRAALARNGLGNVKIVALCNDTVGTLAAARYTGHADAFGGMVLGTGWNAALTLPEGEIAKLTAASLARDGGRMMVDTEWENFTAVPRTDWDVALDASQASRGGQLAEKMVSGRYLGEIARRIMKDMIAKRVLFDGRTSDAFDRLPAELGADGFLTEDMSAIEADASADLAAVGEILARKGIADTTYQDRSAVKAVCFLVSTRAARIVAAATSALVMKADPSFSRDVYEVAIDGSLFEKYPHFAERIMDGLKELHPVTYEKIHLVGAKDGSGLGATVIAAVASPYPPEETVARGDHPEEALLVLGLTDYFRDFFKGSDTFTGRNYAQARMEALAPLGLSPAADNAVAVLDTLARTDLFSRRVTGTGPEYTLTARGKKELAALRARYLTKDRLVRSGDMTPLEALEISALIKSVTGKEEWTGSEFATKWSHYLLYLPVTPPTDYDRVRAAYRALMRLADAGYLERQAGAIPAEDRYTLTDKARALFAACPYAIRDNVLIRPNGALTAAAAFSDNDRPGASAADRFTTAIQVPSPLGHSDLKAIQPRKTAGDQVGPYQTTDLIVPKNPDRIFTPDELVQVYRANGQKRIVVEHDPAMTFMSGHALTSIMQAAQFKYTIGLATGGTTEALRKLMGLADTVERLYGTTIDADKIRKICTLDNYYFMDYIKRHGFTDAEAEKVLAIASYESEQLYMMIRNMMGGEVEPGFFIAPPSRTNKSWSESADEFRMLLAKHFCVERFVQLWQLHGIGTNSHDGFNEIYNRLRRDLTGVVLEFYRTGEVKRMLMKDGTDLADLGLRTLPSFAKIPGEFRRLGMLRDDHATLISFIIQVQNNGHFNDLMVEIMKNRGEPAGAVSSFHPFFLKFMGDHSLYDVDELVTAIQLSTPEELLRYTDNPRYHFRDMRDFVEQLEFLFKMYASVPPEATTQGIGGILRRGSLPLPDGTFPMQLFMASAAHKQLAVLRALMEPSEWSTASTVLYKAQNALFVATEESLGMVSDPFTMDSFIKVRPDRAGDILGLHGLIESAWELTPPGRQTKAIEESGSAAPAKKSPEAIEVRSSEGKPVSPDMAGEDRLIAETSAGAIEVVSRSSFAQGDALVDLAVWKTSDRTIGDLQEAIAAYLAASGIRAAAKSDGSTVLDEIMRFGSRDLAGSADGKTAYEIHVNGFNPLHTRISFLVVKVDLTTDAHTVVANGTVNRDEAVSRALSRVYAVIMTSDYLNRRMAESGSFSLADYTAVCPEFMQASAKEDLAILVHWAVLSIDAEGAYHPGYRNVNDNFAVAHAYFSERGETQHDEALPEGRHAINEMQELATAAGLEIPTHERLRYTLLLPQLFYGGADLREDQARFGDRFELDIVPGLDTDMFIRNLRGRVRNRERSSIVLVPNDLKIPDAVLKELAGLGVRFMQVDAQALSALKGEPAAERARFRTDTYAIMWLARFISADATKDDATYRLLRYYLETHFAFSGNLAADDYIQALVKGDIAKIILACLSYRPIVPHDAVADYHAIAETLISA